MGIGMRIFLAGRSNLEGVASDGHDSGKFALEIDGQTGLLGYSCDQRLIGQQQGGLARKSRVVKAVWATIYLFFYLQKRRFRFFCKLHYALFSEPKLEA